MSQFPEEMFNLTSRQGFGYFPSYPGQRLNEGRYEIIRKLGYGPRSSVWLVADSHCVIGLNDAYYFAIKMLTAHETLQKPSYELDALNIAATHGYLNLYETFTEDSHHGTHLCLVIDVAGPSYEDLRLTSPTLSLPRHIVQRAIACVVEELEKLHKFGLIHGAVTASNIAFELDVRRDSLDPELAELPPCVIERNVLIDDVEYPIVRSHPIPNGIEWNDSWGVINRCVMNLLNLGHAQKIQGTPTWEKSRMNKSLRPPEVILGMPFSPKVDVWMLGCATYHMLTGKPLVDEEKAADDGVMLGWLIAMSGGHITPDTALKSKLRTKYYNGDGLFKLEIPKETLESQISSSGVVLMDDIPGIVKFIQTCLTMDPAERPNEWVKPGFEG